MPGEADSGPAIPEVALDQTIAAAYAPQTARLMEDFKDNQRARPTDSRRAQMSAKSGCGSIGVCT